MDYKTTADIPLPEKLMDSVIGQDRAAKIIRNAAKQRRNILLIGEPGTGKSMLAQAMAELMPAEELEDVLIYPNPNDENRPLVKAVKTYSKDPKIPPLPPGAPQLGMGRRILEQAKMRSRMPSGSSVSPAMILFILLFIGIVALSFTNLLPQGDNKWILAAAIIGIFMLASAWIFSSQLQRRLGGSMETAEPKLVVDNTGLKNAPFIDATGSKSGALLGDVRHDPLQCMPAGELLSLQDGSLVTIESMVNPYFEGTQEGERELARSQKILGSTRGFLLEPAEIKKVFRRHYAGEIIILKTRSGSILRVTPNHPIAVFDRRGFLDYVDAEKISLKNKVAIPKQVRAASTAQNSEQDLIHLIADILADAYLGERRIEFNFKRQFKIDLIKQDLSALGLKVCIRTRTDGATQLSANSTEMVRKLLALGIRSGNVKQVPAFIFSLEKREIIRFLSRLISLDGYVDKNGQFQLQFANRLLLKQVRALLLRLGINAKNYSRLDKGYKPGNRQYGLRWGNLHFAKEYARYSINPYHIKNLEDYLKNTGYNKENFDDVVPLDFAVLEEIRAGLGISKEKVHQDYWSVNPAVKNHTRLTRGLLKNIVSGFEKYAPDEPRLAYLNALADGDIAFDTVVSVEREPYDGFVYNLTTSSGNFVSEFILTHNSGGLGTPAHLRVEAGAIHRANKGVLFVDEVSSLGPRSQQELLTAMQERKYSITGQSEMSSGALVKTEPLPCEFVLVAAGNMLDIKNMHPALRSRIRGYGYEIYIESTMPDTPENRDKVVRFVAQEVKKDGKIPHFTREAVEEIIEESKRKAGRKGKLSLRFRELGGLVRAAGDLAREESAEFVTLALVLKAKTVARTLEQQISAQFIDLKKDYSVFSTTGYAVGKVNGLAVMGDASSGLVMPIVAEVTPASSRSEGKLIATGKLGKIAKEAVENVSAIIKKHIGRDVSEYDIHVQFLQTYEGVEGDSASIAIAVSVISAMEGIPVDQSVVMTGSLNVRGEVLPVGGVTAKVEAAIDSGAATALVPKSNLDDIYLGADKRGKIKLIPVSDIVEVLHLVLKKSPAKKKLLASMSDIINGEGKHAQGNKARKK